MTTPHEQWVETAGGRLRIWEKGEGERVAVLGGLFGCPRWTPFLDALAEHRRVIVPALPGFPGGGRGHDNLDDVVDWIVATLDVLEAADAAGVDVLGCSFGAMLAAECAAVAPGSMRRLVLVSPLGLFDEREPVADPWTALPTELPALLCADAASAADYLEAPSDTDESEWPIVRARSAEAAAKLLWPVPDRGIVKRLHRVRIPTLLVWGERDRIIPRSYAGRYARAIPGCAASWIVAGAGHAVELDRPRELADAAVEFFGAKHGS